MSSMSSSYGVTLLCYFFRASGLCLSSVATGRVEADSPQEAVYRVMERSDRLYVDRAEVMLPDGAIWSRNSMFYRNIYSVALWRTDRESELPVTECLQVADSPLLAALSVMQWKNLTYVARAVVRCPDGSTWCKEHLKREKGEEAND